VCVCVPFVESSRREDLVHMLDGTQVRGDQVVVLRVQALCDDSNGSANMSRDAEAELQGM
jgi:hypothetical protein